MPKIEEQDQEQQEISLLKGYLDIQHYYDTWDQKELKTLRVTIGKGMEGITGCLYIPKTMPLPKGVLISIPLEEIQHERDKEIKKEKEDQ